VNEIFRVRNPNGAHAPGDRAIEPDIFSVNFFGKKNAIFVAWFRNQGDPLKGFEIPCFGQGNSGTVIGGRRIEGKIYINYTVVSPDGFATALAVTEDFRTLKRLGIIFHPENKDVCIFPEKIGEKYYALHRPNNSGFGRPAIWLSESPDLLHWGNHRCLLRPRDTSWEAMKIGGGASPIKTAEGWLEIYHGKGEGQTYSLFLALLALDDPSKILKRGGVPILVPEKDYETKGFFPNVVFSNGVAEMGNGKLFIYYGACDESVCMAETSIPALLNSLN